jgi:hypothetical protein
VWGRSDRAAVDHPSESNDTETGKVMSREVGGTMEPARREPTPELGRDHSTVQVRGRAVRTPSLEIHDRPIVVTGTWLKIAAVRDEDLVDGETVPDPVAFVSRLKAAALTADIFTFAQKLPDTVPRFPYHLEWDNLAVIPITSYADWWEKRVESSVRRAVRKGTKLGVVGRVAELDSAFVKGIADIYNETPIRQGRPFWHYQKDLETVRRENSTYSDRSVLIGVYLQDELIAFMRMILVDTTASIIQILSKEKHFDKRPTNVMLAKAVELCESKGISHLVYCSYVYNDPKSSLTEFKRRNGFQQVLVPRYYVPLTLRGRLALRLNLHRGFARLIPAPVVTQLRNLRARWHHRAGVVKEEV